MDSLVKNLVLYLGTRISECKDSMVKVSMCGDSDEFRKALYELIAFSDVLDWLNDFKMD